MLFNKLFDLRYFPADWSEGFIVPLHKKGDTDDVCNYRGITLLSTYGLKSIMFTWFQTAYGYC